MNDESVHAMIDSFQPALSASQMLDSFLNNSQDAIVFKDLESRYTLVSKAFAAQFAIDDPRRLAGKSDFDFYPADYALRVQDDEAKILQSGLPLLGQIEKWDKTDNEAVWYSASRFPLYDGQGAIVGTWATMQDITPLLTAEEELNRVAEELELANARLKNLSTIDMKSGLMNQKQFYKSIQTTADYFRRYRSTESNGTFCLLLIDIDYFAGINDIYGPKAGDAVLRHVADVIKAKSRSSDTSFRLESDDFAMLLPSTSLGNSRVLAERIRSAVATTPLLVEDKAVCLTISLGVACYSEDMTIIELIKQAEANLGLAKQEGRNQAR